VIGIDIGKNSFHVVGLDDPGAIVLRQKWSRGQLETRFANMPRCLKRRLFAGECLPSPDGDVDVERIEFDCEA
jgi:hypothetical protein